jgi:GNAT superfamily N-acetyltransferase
VGGGRGMSDFDLPLGARVLVGNAGPQDRIGGVFMTTFVKGHVAAMRQKAIAAQNMQDWMAEGLGRAARYPGLVDLDTQMVLAVDGRNCLIGSYMVFPSLNDPWVKEQAEAGNLPFDAARAFTPIMVWVHKSRRGEGIGATLSREAQELAASLGKDTLFVYGQATDAIWDFTGHI